MEYKEETEKFVAIAISESYIWHGFGSSIERAEQALVSQWNEFFGDDETIDSFPLLLFSAMWIDGNGYVMEL